MKLGVIESLHQVSTMDKHRGKFTDTKNHEKLVQACLMLTETQQADSHRIATVSVKCLINACSLNLNSRVYVPGENCLVHLYKRKSFEKGTYALLAYLASKLKDNP